MLQEFINKWNGKYADFDGWYGAQCVDIVQYYREALDLPKFRGNADEWVAYRSSRTEWVPNTPTNYPSPGDIVVLSANTKITVITRR